MFERRFSRWELVFCILVPVIVGQAWGLWPWLGAFAFGIVVQWIYGEKND